MNLGSRAKKQVLKSGWRSGGVKNNRSFLEYSYLEALYDYPAREKRHGTLS